MTCRARVRNSEKPSNHLGFTLIEVLIALTIFAIMGLASYQLLSGEVRVQQQLQQASQRIHHLQRGMQRLSQDLRQIVLRPVRADYGDNEPALIGNSDSITFTRNGWSNALGRPRSDLQRVHYEIILQENNSYLERQFWNSLDRAPGSEPVRQLVLPDITEIRLRYLDSEKEQWLEHWPPNGEASNDLLLPLAIEFTLMSSSYGEITRLLTLRGPM